MRNKNGLNKDQIQKARIAWEFLTQEDDTTIRADTIVLEDITFDTNSAHLTNSKTVFQESTLTVKLGADAYPGQGTDANSIMSLLACLCHELSHAQRLQLGFHRPITDPAMNLDEAETSIHASYHPVLSIQDRKHLIQDAKKRIAIWEEKI